MLPDLDCGSCHAGGVPQVEVETDSDDSGHGLVSAKITDDRWELNVRAQVPDFLSLSDIRSMDWNSRRVASVGTCLGAAVFWSSDGDTATIMVGHDDETWDLAVSIAVEVVDDLVRQVRLL